MKHAHKKFDRIQDLAGEIPEDEPVFLLRGQDILAPDVVDFWVQSADSQGVSKEMVDRVQKLANDMREWQSTHARKLPDLPTPTEPFWLDVDRNWADYPVGTKARESWGNSIWEKVATGWKSRFGDTFPTPGAANQVMLPNKPTDL